ncbi:PspC domain-containing protein [Limnofasciculus baicalensis]|uniref:PspC domain-containing protein n=1 Tax=Limnofasciculus baicalensis BBK-W-15 TaxID=2699891 RepID=A0AAE3GNY3_9CYAN|nr:PspC domain-containing protein [Limnofasciculus baicalensis]MCP2727392.1 PspC domain-containing protein [Limnofasciculus baicalensis BBK-W-15]
MIYLPLISILFLVGPALAAIAITRSLNTRGHLVLLGMCILYGIFPLLVTWGGMGLAKRFGCSAEAVRFICPSSSWLGGVISGMFMAHWLAIFAIPSAILGAIGLLISLILKVKRSNANTPVMPRTIFHRSRHKVFAGVCYALSQLWNLPILGVRIVTVILAIVLPGFIFLYFWCWLAFPIEPRSQQQPVGKQS